MLKHVWVTQIVSTEANIRQHTGDMTKLSLYEMNNHTILQASLLRERHFMPFVM